MIKIYIFKRLIEKTEELVKRINKLGCRFNLHDYEVYVCRSTHLHFGKNGPVRYQKKHRTCKFCGKTSFTKTNQTPIEPPQFEIEK